MRLLILVLKYGAQNMTEFNAGRALVVHRKVSTRDCPRCGNEFTARIEAEACHRCKNLERVRRCLAKKKLTGNC